MSTPHITLIARTGIYCVVLRVNILWRNGNAHQMSDNRDQRGIMDVSKILVELRQEREQLEEAILSLERLVSGRGKRRGRPPAWMAEARKGQPSDGKQRPVRRKSSSTAA